MADWQFYGITFKPECYKGTQMKTYYTYIEYWRYLVIRIRGSFKILKNGADR